jgi:HEAT repeat protein
MRVISILCLSVGVAIASGRLSIAQDERPFDYSKKPLGKWIEALKDKDSPELRNRARRALGPDGAYAKVAVPALIDAFRDKDLPGTSDVAETLADYGPTVVPSLARALKKSEAPVRAGVAEALGCVRPKSIEAVRALTDAMKDSAPEVRAAVARSLGNIGGSAHEAIPSLISALQDAHDPVREAAALALGQMGQKSKPAIPALMLALKDKSGLVRTWAAQALLKLGPDAKAAVPALVEALQNKRDNGVRSWFAQALGGIGPAAKAAVPALVEALGEKDDSLRIWAAIALGEIGAKAAVPALIEAAKDKGNGNGGREYAIEALGKIGPGAKAAVPILLEALGTREPLAFRCTVAEALGGMGAAAKAALPALTAIARDRSAYGPARKTAAEAVMKIDSEFGASQRLETAYLNVRLGKVPVIPLAPRPASTEGQKKRIKALIAKLAEIKKPDLGMSGTLIGHAFAPLTDQARIEGGLITNHDLKQSDALRNLVEIGPEALPFLLEALEDKTSTRLKVEHGSGMLGGMFLSSTIEGNPLNPIEMRVLSRPEKPASEDNEPDGRLSNYTVKVGDVCFVAIGQIVGRRYDAVRYQPTAMIVLGSPVLSKELRERVRALWSGKDPAKMLLDSLLIDYATEGIFNGETLDGWYDGSNVQVEAAMRLLYYFPKETASLTAARLRSFDVQKAESADDGWMKREVKNGVRTDEFIKAVAWCTVPAIQEALADIAKRTNDPDIKAVLEQRRKRNP